MLWDPIRGQDFGHRFILVATHLCTKWVAAKAAPTAKAKPLIQFLQEICRRWGYPEQTITDNAAAFRGSSWRQFHARHSIESYVSPIYHQRANPVERRNQELKKLLRIHGRDQSEHRWDEVLDEALFALRNRANAAIGMTPSEALLGAPLVRAGEWTHPQVLRAIENNQQAREERLQQVRQRQIIFNRNLYPEQREAPIEFRVGQQVLVRNFPGTRGPLDAPWSGPFPVIARRADGVYELDRNGSTALIHVDDIRPAPRHDPEEESPRREALVPAGDVEELQDNESHEEAPVWSREAVVEVEDLPDDPGDPGEACNIPGRLPIAGLYP